MYFIRFYAKEMFHVKYVREWLFDLNLFVNSLIFREISLLETECVRQCIRLAPRWQFRRCPSPAGCRSTAVGTQEVTRIWKYRHSTVWKCMQNLCRKRKRKRKNRISILAIVSKAFHYLALENTPYGCAWKGNHFPGFKWISGSKHVLVQWIKVTCSTSATKRTMAFST